MIGLTLYEKPRLEEILVGVFYLERERESNGAGENFVCEAEINHEGWELTGVGR
jgi:hypothetical protein